jgi:uncharacterized protein YkwD
LPFLLFLGGFPCAGFLDLSPVPECRGDVLTNTPNTIGYETEAALEEELLELTNQHRIGQGLRVLASDDALMQIAREHSYEMAQQGFISHDLPSGDLKTRMHRASYLYEIVRENVARASTIAIAQKLLVNSTKHKNNILATDVTRMGIGIVRQKPPDKYLYITEIFAIPREKYSPAVVRNLALNRVNELQCQSGLVSVQTDPLLENLASRSVSSLEIPVKRADLQRLLADSADELIREGRTELSRLEVAVQVLRNPKNLRMPDQARERGAGMFGTAVRQVTDDQNQAKYLVLTLIGFSPNSQVDISKN